MEEYVPASELGGANGLGSRCSGDLASEASHVHCDFVIRQGNVHQRSEGLTLLSSRIRLEDE